MRSTLITSLLAALVTLAVIASTAGAQTDRAGDEFFETTIRPVLVSHCYECHSTKSGKAKGGLKVDSRAALLTGGDTGPAIVGKSLDKSLLYQSISYEGDYQMPPSGKLPAAVIANFRKWVLMGAPDPRVIKLNPDVRSEINVEEGRNFWAYQSPADTDPPASPSSAWARTKIDRFVIARLDEYQLSPVSDATPRQLVRRLYFVLTGLPPSPEAINTWTLRISAQASERERQRVILE